MQSDPGLRWQLCYDFSARSWWMVGWMLPVSPSSRAIDPSLSLSLSALVLLHFSALNCTSASFGFIFKYLAAAPAVLPTVHGVLAACF